MWGPARHKPTSISRCSKISLLTAKAHRKLQFRAELFNIMNTPQFQIPNRTFNTPQFGTILETINDNRDVQFALRFLLPLYVENKRIFCLQQREVV